MKFADIFRNVFFVCASLAILAVAGVIAIIFLMVSPGAFKEVAAREQRMHEAIEGKKLNAGAEITNGTIELTNLSDDYWTSVTVIVNDEFRGYSKTGGDRGKTARIRLENCTRKDGVTFRPWEKIKSYKVVIPGFKDEVFTP